MRSTDNEGVIDTGGHNRRAVWNKLLSKRQKTTLGSTEAAETRKCLPAKRRKIPARIKTN
jgi:hypothetical protein